MFQFGPCFFKVGQEESSLVHEHFDDLSKLMGIILLKITDERISVIHDNIITAGDEKRGRGEKCGQFDYFNI